MIVCTVEYLYIYSNPLKDRRVKKLPNQLLIAFPFFLGRCYIYTYYNTYLTLLVFDIPSYRYDIPNLSLLYPIIYPLVN